MTTEYNDGIRKDTSVLSPNVYIRGQGCGTIWFNSVDQARRFIKKYGYNKSGENSGLCEKCSCYYSVNDPAHNEYQDHACRVWKENIAKEVEDHNETNEVPS